MMDWIPGGIIGYLLFAVHAGAILATVNIIRTPRNERASEGTDAQERGSWAVLAVILWLVVVGYWWWIS